MGVVGLRGGDARPRLGHESAAAGLGARGACSWRSGALAGALGETVPHFSCLGLRPSHLIELLPPFVAPAWLQVVPACRCRQ